MPKGSKIVLRAPREEDTDFLVAVRNDTELQQRVMARPRLNTAATIAEWLQRRAGDDNAVFFIVADTSEDRPYGYIQLVNIDRHDGVGELGIVLGDECQGRGYGREALGLLEDYAREAALVRKIILRVLAHNRRAVSFFERAGYSRVGTHERHHRQGDSFHDVLLMEKHLREPQKADDNNE